MNYLANIQKEIISAEITNASFIYVATNQDTAINLGRTKQQFLVKLPVTHLTPFHQQLIRMDIATTENKREDALWLTEVKQHVVTSLGAYEFTLQRLSELIYVSPRQIRRRLKQLTGKTFSQYLKEARLQVAYQLLVQREVKTIKKLAYRVGLRDVKHFSKLFKAYYGDKPSAFLA